MLLTWGYHLKPSRKGDRFISSKIPWMELSPVESLNPQPPREESRGWSFPTSVWSVLVLGIKWRGGFWALGFGGEHGKGRARDGELRGLGRWMSRWEWERDLNAVGPQNNQLGSDRSPIPVRPVRADLAQADRNNLGALSRGLKLMTVINLIN